MKHGASVSAFEAALAERCDARFAIAMSNGTVTIQVALMSLGVQPGTPIATSPLTMAATSIAILNAGAVPRYVDVDPRTWLMSEWSGIGVGVSLYGLHHPNAAWHIDDAAQTFRRHSPHAAFTSLSFQRSKIVNTGEGGALLTNDEELATRARSIASLGYQLSPTQSRIDSATLKRSDFARHHYVASQNGRMNDVTAVLGLKRLKHADDFLRHRREAGFYYAEAVRDCAWLTPQHAPDGWTHDYWTFAVACDTPERARWLQDAMVRHGGEMPYGAWRLTYHEPAFTHLAPGLTDYEVGSGRAIETRGAPCPVAESLQPRLLQFQTNDHLKAERNVVALRRAIAEASD